MKYVFPYSGIFNNTIDIAGIEQVYERINDDISKRIYRDRILLSMTKNLEFARDLILTTDAGCHFFEMLKNLPSIWIYGHGIRGTRLLEMFPEINWKGFIDQKVSCHVKENDIELIPYSEMLNLIKREDVIIISNFGFGDEIKKCLIQQGIYESQIIVLDDYEKDVAQNQYVEERCVAEMKEMGGLFIDAGCYDGSDSKKALSNYPNINRIVAFEPDKINYLKCVENLNSIKSVTLYEAGLSDKHGVLSFVNGECEKSRVSNWGSSFIDVYTIDELFESEKVGIIKMDIEGYEAFAIEGGRHVIRRDKPGLVVSVYHNEEDIFVIPQLMLKINPDYRFCFGHYGIGGPSETVLYAF